MGIEREFARAAFGLAIALAAAASSAAPQPEPLVVTQLADPDPNYIPLPAVSKPQSKTLQAEDDQDPTLNEAMQKFGRAIGQAGMLEQQQVDAREPGDLPDVELAANRSIRLRFQSKSAISGKPTADIGATDRPSLRRDARPSLR